MQSPRDAQHLPFSGPLDADRFHCGPSQQEALARLHFLVERGYCAGLVTGDSGLGKTWLLGTFRRALAGTGCEVVAIDLRGTDAYEFLWQLVVQLGCGMRPGQSLGQLWRQVSDHLEENRWLGRGTVLLLDNATTATMQVLGQIVRLAAFASTGRSHVTMVFACDPRRLAHLGPQLLSLSTLCTALTPWTEAETIAHLDSILAHHGNQLPPLSRAAAILLHQLSSGVPRTINRLADLATLAAADSGLAQTDTATITAVGS